MLLTTAAVIAWLGALICLVVAWMKRPNVTWLVGWGLMKAARGRPEWKATHQWLRYAGGFALGFVLILLGAVASDGSG